MTAKILKKKELDQFKELLLEEKRKILHHLEDISESSEESLNLSGDSADIASTEINQAALQKIGKREQSLVKKIELALKKIEDGTYGECESCGEQIGFARLMARPVAQLCIDCKTEQENNERKFSNREPSDDDDDTGEESSDDSE